MDIFIQEMLTDFTSFLKKTFTRVINKHYGRSAKGILSEPTRGFPHTKVSSMYPLVTYNRGNKTLSTRFYSARLTRQEENKRLQGYARLIWLVGNCICGSITKRASLYSISLAVIISSLTNHSMYAPVLLSSRW